MEVTPLTHINDFIELEDGSCNFLTGYKGVYTHPVTHEIIPVLIKLVMASHHTEATEFKWLDEWQRLRRRLEKLYGVPHPCLPPVLGLFPEGDHIFIVYRFYENGEIIPYLKANPEVSALEMVLKIAKALEVLHKENLACGEPTPPHILVSDDGEPVVTCIRLPPSIFGHKEKSHPYSAPELWRHSAKTIDPEKLMYSPRWEGIESDVYAFSLTVIHILSGKLPVGEDAKQHISDTNKVVRKEYPNIPDALWPTLEACWERLYFHRPAMSQLVEALEAVRTK